MAGDWCAIDFGTSNSAVALPAAGDTAALVPLEDGQPTMPTAVFYRADGPVGLPPACEFGRAALAAYVDGAEGRLMRSMKSILGSDLAEQHTDIGGGRSVPYAEVVEGYLRHLKRQAERHGGHPLRRAVIGRPVHFVDDDPVRDAQAQAALESAARRVGFEEIHFQYEPLAAALDHERGLANEQLVLVADIGGGTSDFSLVRLGPQRRQRLERAQDILAHHGVHIAGTDFDRRVSLAALMPELGFGSFGPSVGGRPPRQVPSRVYFDLSTWHLINTVYAPARVAEWRRLRGDFAQPRLHARLMNVLEHRLGHALAAQAEHLKIETARHGRAVADLQAVDPGLTVAMDEAAAGQAIEADCARIEDAARETARQGGVDAADVQAVYLTGGSTGLAPLVRRILRHFPQARAVHGDPFASVARGLGESGRRRFEA